MLLSEAQIGKSTLRIVFIVPSVIVLEIKERQLRGTALSYDRTIGFAFATLKPISVRALKQKIKNKK